MTEGASTKGSREINNRVRIAVALACFGLAGPLAAQTITEFPIPTAGSYPGGITAGPDGNLWFAEGTAQKIGRITTAGVVTEFPIPTGYPGLSRPAPTATFGSRK